MDDPLLTGLWAVVMTGPKMLLARLRDYKTTDQNKAEEDFEANKVFLLEPALDYFSPIHQMQKDGQAAIGRNPLVMPFEFTTEPTRVLSRLNMMCFLDDMSIGDRKLYISFIAATEKAMSDARVQRLGLITANGPLPKMPNA